MTTVTFGALLSATMQLGCAGAKLPDAAAAVPDTLASDSITAVTHHRAALILSRSATEGCRIEEHRAERAEPTTITTVGTCPERMRYLNDDDLLLESSTGDVIAGGETTPESGGPGILSLAAEGNYVTRTAGELIWNRDGSVARVEGAWTGPVAILDREDAVLAVRRDAEGERLVRLEWPETGSVLEETVLTDPLEKIHAIEPDHDQKELALSVSRDHSRDIAIANAEEPIMNWVPSDPADEVRPRWSPVGYKLSYVVRNRGGDILRTVHVPTAAMVLLDFPDSRVIDYAWLPDGERVVVALSSVTSSDHVIEATYTGSSKTVVVDPRHHYDRQIERLPGTPAGSSLIMPGSVSYDERRPLVIWLTGGTAGAGGFDPDLIPLLERLDLGLLIFNGSSADLGPSLWSEIEEMRWVSRDEVWLVGPVGSEATVPRWVQRSGIETARWLDEYLAKGPTAQ